MLTFESIFLKKLRLRLNEERETRLNALLDRKPYEEYLNRIGYIQGLTYALDIAEEINKELTSPEKS